MKTNTFSRNKLDTIFWALLFIWWGLRWSVLRFLPEGSGLVGTGLLLFAGIAALRSAGLPANPNNTFFGLLTLLSGGALVVIDLMHLSVELPIFETFLIVLGVVLLGYALLGKKQQVTSES